MSVQFKCKCGEEYELDDSFANKNMICKRCKMIIDLPDAKYDTPELVEPEIPLEEAISSIHAKLNELGIASIKRAISPSFKKTSTLANCISQTIDCSCGYKGLAIHDSSYSPFHFFLFLLGLFPGWFALLVIEQHTHGYYCPMCNKKKSRENPLPTVPLQSIPVIIKAAQKKALTIKKTNIGIIVTGTLFLILLAAFLVAPFIIVLLHILSKNSI